MRFFLFRAGISLCLKQQIFMETYTPARLRICWLGMRQITNRALNIRGWQNERTNIYFAENLWMAQDSGCILGELYTNTGSSCWGFDPDFLSIPGFYTYKIDLVQLDYMVVV